MRCPDCSNIAWRNGYRKLPTNHKMLQIWKCSECERQFTNRSNTAFNRMRYPKKIILYALKLHYKHGLSSYAIAQLLEMKSVKVSHVAVFKWLKKYKHLAAQSDLAEMVNETKEAMIETAAK